MQPTPHRVGLVPWLVIGVVLLCLAPAAFAAYTGRPGLVLTGKVVEGYDSELVQSDAGLTSTHTSAVTGEIASVATATVPTLTTAGRTTVSVCGLASVSTATVTVLPCYGHVDGSGNVIWLVGSAVTLTARSDVTHSSMYEMPKGYVDTDGVAYMKLVPVAITGGGTVKIFGRVN